MDNYNIYRQNPPAGGNANKLVVFLHGYGADGKDLIDLANPFGMALPNASFISPDAPHPCAMSPQGRQWFPIEEIPKGAINASLGLLDLIEREAKKLNLTFKDVVLIGFSLRAIIGYSGALREENIDAANEQIFDGKHKFSDTPILLVHGEQDEVVPFQSLDRSKNLLNKIGFDVETLSRPNLAHGIDPEGISKGMQFLKALN